MPVGTIQMYSAALERPVTFTILLPDPLRVGKGPYHVLLQLHGKFDDHHAWLVKSNLAEYVVNLPLIVVLPDGGNFFWADAWPNLRYESFLMHDLLPYVSETFPVRRDSRWAIGGLSMGGFGALRLGLKYTDRFCSVYAHSSAILEPDEVLESKEAADEAVAADMNCFAWALRADRAMLPRLSFDCGTEDWLIEHNRRFHAYLEQIGLPHTYVEHPGAHTWDYWDRHVQTAIRQHCDVFSIEPVAQP
jgi:putative tributyrin esterase